MWGFVLFAQPWGRRDPFQSPDVIWGTAGLALALLAGALLVYLADRWRKRQIAADGEAAEELSDFRRMFVRGEISQEEYTRLRERVARRMKAPPGPFPQPPTAGNVQTAPNAAAPNAADLLPGPDQPTPPPDPGRPANPSPPA